MSLTTEKRVRHICVRKHITQKYYSQIMEKWMAVYKDIFIINTANILRRLMFEGNGNLITQPERVQEPPYVL